MKRLVAVLSGLLVLPAFAEVMPVFFDEEIEYVDGDVSGDIVVDDASNVQDDARVNTPVTAPTNLSPRNATRATSRAVASGNAATATRNNATGTRNVATRAGVSRAATTTTNNVSTRNNVVSRAGTSHAAVTSAANSNTATTPSRAAVSARAGASTTGTTAVQRRGTTTSTTNTARAGTSLIQTDTVNTPLYTGRVSVRGSSSGVSTRSSSVLGASQVLNTPKLDDTTSLDELAQLTDFCKAQYMQCMDTYCNTLDDNQGRCSCSANLKNYEKIEAALKQATTDLQSVAQNIQYIGLTADQVASLFQQTEAEAEMSGQTDTSQLKSDLDKIRGLIIDVKSGSSTSSASTSGITMDLSGLLDFSVDSTGFDLSSLFSGMSSNTTSVANQRGEQLYKTATARCKASVLNSCVASGVDANVITNSYDLEIDKQCMAYERSLTDANDQMRSTVTNAQNLLQRARLMVSEQKNVYDLRGCVTALDECMQNDFVCGDDYKNCLDPSGRYIVNGAVVVGSTPGKAGDTDGNLYSTWIYDTNKNPWSADANKGSLADYISKKINNASQKDTSSDMAEFLQNKIGYIDSNNKAVGMCAAVLNQCQDYTYTRTGTTSKYDPTNTVVKEYLQRTMTQIKAAQDTLLAEYAEDCVSDVRTCLIRSASSSDYTKQNVRTLATKSCQSIVTTCMSVNAYGNNQEDEFVKWVLGVEDNDGNGGGQ